MWSYTYDDTLLPNITVKSCIKDGTLDFYQLYPDEGYVLRIPTLDKYQMDDEGNYVLDENGEHILVTPYRTYGGAVELPGYDWTTNPEGYYAELYDESMIVFGVPEDRPELI